MCEQIICFGSYLRFRYWNLFVFWCLEFVTCGLFGLGLSQVSLYWDVPPLNLHRKPTLSYRR